MRTEIDCGIAAQAFVRSVIFKTSYDEEYDKLDLIWKFPKKDNFLSNFRDFPGAHYRIMKKMGMRYQLIDPENMSWKMIPNQTIVLLHGLTIPESPSLDQHWAVVQSVTATDVNLHLGNGKTYQFPINVFRNKYYAGFPNCMYVMGEGETNQHMLEQFIDWLLSWVI